MAEYPSAVPFKINRMMLSLQRSCDRVPGFIRFIAIRPIFRESSVSSFSYNPK